MEQKKLQVQRIIFDSDNFLVVACKDLESNHSIKAVFKRDVPKLSIKQKIVVEGDVVKNKYGKSIEVQSWNYYVPNNRVDMVSYLSSKRFKGIGKKVAQKIVDAYELEVLTQKKNKKWETSSENLSDIEKAILFNQQLLYDTIGKKKAYDIIHTIENSESDFKFRKLFAKNELNENIINKLVEMEYTNEEIDEIIHSNMYEWAFNNDIDLTFNEVDDVMYVLNREIYDTQRDKWLILDTLKQRLNSNGDTWMKLNTFKNYLKKVGVNQETIELKLNELHNIGLIKIIDERITLKKFYEIEKKNAEVIVRRVNKGFDFTDDELKLINKSIDEVEKEIGESMGTDFKYDDTQRKAIIMFLAEPVMLLQGGAGTGKSKVVQGMVKVYQKIYEEEGKKVVLLAPTGKASNRLNEIDNSFKASTIHHFFEEGIYNTGEVLKNKPITDIIKCDAIIVDEASMLDIFTLSMILTQAEWDKLVLVGDINQLPSVNVGDVLWDLNLSGLVPMVKLKTTHRSSEESGVIQLANKIENHQIHSLADINNIHNVRNMIGYKTPVKEILNNYIDYIKKHYDYNDWQILAPVYKLDNGNGIIELNKLVQSKFHNVVEGKQFGGYTYTKGDKVLFTKNDKKTKITNGETGIIADLEMKTKTKVSRLTIKSLLNDEYYNFKDNEIFKDLSLGYVCSIHKSQGSEYQEVAIVFDTDGSRFMDRRNVYTAITRSKDKLVLLGNEQDFLNAVNRQPRKRQTFMVELLKDLDYKAHHKEISWDEFNRIFDKKKQEKDNDIKLSMSDLLKD